MERTKDSMLGLPPEFIIFDTEYTAWEGSVERDWTGPNEYREVVEIGAIRVDGQTLAELDHFRILVRPAKNPRLSDYFTRLTGITQDMVDQDGVDYGTALEQFSQWSGTLPIYAFGDDAKTLEKNAQLVGVRFPFELARFKDMRLVFQERGIRTEQYMSSTIVTAFGKEPTRTGHTALNDARTILDGLRALAKRED